MDNGSVIRTEDLEEMEREILAVCRDVASGLITFLIEFLEFLGITPFALRT